MSAPHGRPTDRPGNPSGIGNPGVITGEQETRAAGPTLREHIDQVEQQIHDLAERTDTRHTAEVYRHACEAFDQEQRA